MDHQPTGEQIARLGAAIRNALAEADALGLLEVGIHLDQARLAALAAAARFPAVQPVA